MTLRPILCACALVAMPPARAASDWAISGNVGLRSTYVSRGIGQTDGNPSRFFGADVAWRDAFYVGTWSSNVDFSASGDRHTQREYDVYAGWRRTLGVFTLDLGYARYIYSHQPRNGRLGYAEWYVRGSVPAGPVLLGLSVNYSPDYPGMAGRAYYTEASAAWAIDAAWTLSGVVARQQEAHAMFHGNGRIGAFGYNAWNIGVTWRFSPMWSTDLRYWDTDAHESGSPFHPHLVASLKADI
ncbi:TorF family putative porin [Luteibacter anthropi]|uniref:TorF family putative porin n=1 Tax=Luteibacter anthropi TaxID=564369 RepID=UPI0020321D42|nr:TorF family putative porin [Luteibacter anthropi]URX63332.1 TorF family putative porin [Luteibacter anthropi]